MSLERTVRVRRRSSGPSGGPPLEAAASRPDPGPSRPRRAGCGGVDPPTWRSWSPRAGRGRIVRSLVVLVCVVVGSPLRGGAAGAEAAPPGIPPEARRLEDAGDRARDVARPRYLESLQTWGEVCAAARASGDLAAASRARVSRAGLAVLAREASLLDDLRRETGAELALDRIEESGRSAPYGLTSSVVPAEDALQRLARFLAAARSRSATLPGRDARDDLLVSQLLGMVQKAIGDEPMRRADDAYRGALAILAPASAGSDRVALARIQSFRARLHLRLREFRACADLLASRAWDPSLLPSAERREHLRTVRDLARLQGDRARYLATVDQLLALGDKAEETPRTGLSPPRLFAGSAVDLAATAQTLLAMLGGFKMSPWERALVAYSAGSAVESLGENALAEEILRSEPIPSSEDVWLSGAMASRLGFVRGELGTHEAALAALEQAEDLTARLEGSELARARIGINQARSLLALGQLDRAGEEALSLLADGSLPVEVRAAARLLLGGVLYEQSREDPRKLTEAKRAIEAARAELEEARKGGAAVPQGVALELSAGIALGNVIRMEAASLSGDAAASRRDRAIELQEGAMRAAFAANELVLAAIASSNLGELYLEAGKLEAGKGFVEWALDRAREKRLVETEWRCHWYLARIADASGDAATADARYAQAEAVLGSYRSSILGAERKAGFLTDKMSFYRDLVRRSLGRNRPDEALSAAERARARALVESLGLRFLAFSDPADTATYRQYVEAESRAEKDRTAPASSFLGVRVKPSDYEQLRRRVAEIRDRVEKSLPPGHVLRALLGGESLDAREIVGAVPAGSTLVEYFALDQSYVALIAAEGRVEAVSLPVTPDELSRTVSGFVLGWAQDAAVAARLHDWLVRPIEPKLKGRRLVIVPHGPLHQVPFEALRASPAGAGAARGPYLIERYEVSYLPSGTLLPLFRQRPRPPAGALNLVAVADPATDYDQDGRPDMPPLPFAQKEVGDVAPFFASRTILPGPEATKARALEQAPKGDVVHYACHGEFYANRPWDSSLFLAPEPEPGQGRRDGRLRASEVFAHDLRRSRLVALSGCETGKGRVMPGDDTIGISSAFLHSGASSVLVSLWKVEDRATAALMKSFYGHWLKEGIDKVRALRSAKLELLGGEFSEPRLWAAFVLQGEP